jgi:hypothetical protein
MITVVIIATVEWRRRNPLELDAHPHWEAKRWKKAKRKGTNRVAVQVKRRGRSNLFVGLVRSFVRSFPIAPSSSTLLLTSYKISPPPAPRPPATV